MPWCPDCGAEYRKGFTECADCGAVLSDKRKTPKNPYAEVFVGENYEFYKSKWDARENSFYKGWNWAAFFMNVFWMAYRKMYLESAIAITLLVVLTEATSSGGGLGLAIIFGALGNALYCKRYQRLLAKCSGKNSAATRKFLLETGGTSVLAIFLAVVFMVLVTLLVTAPF